MNKNSPLNQRYISFIGADGEHASRTPTSESLERPCPHFDSDHSKSDCALYQFRDRKVVLETEVDPNVGSFVSILDVANRVGPRNFCIDTQKIDARLQ